MTNSSQTAALSLDGQRIVLTRSDEDNAKWAARLRLAGAEPIELPCIRTELIDGDDLRRDLRETLAQADWLILTSRRGVDALVALGMSEAAATCRIATVGKATAQNAHECFGRVDLTGSGTALDLGRELIETGTLSAGDLCVAALAANAGPVLVEMVERCGARCRRFDVYRTLPSEPSEPRTHLSTLAPDAIVFASPSAVTGFVNCIEIDRPCRAFSIGPSTSAAMREHGLAITAEASEPSFDGIIALLLEPTDA
jgi:uroporphyrinogen-III synthase